MLKSFHTLPLQGKTGLVRFDYNIPHDATRILDDTRLRASLETLKDFRSLGAKVIIISHLGRPKTYDPTYSLSFIVPALEKICGEPVIFCDQIKKKSVELTWNKNPHAHIMLLENLRFYPEEEANDTFFAKNLAALADVYVNDAFSVSHRAHASVSAITQHLPAYAGHHMMKEITALQRSFKNPKHPVIGILGGSKISSKFNVIHHMIHTMDHVFLGGAMAHTFLYAMGFDVGDSLLEKDYKEAALSLLESAKTTGCQVHLPTDLWGAETIYAPAQCYTLSNIPSHFQGFDIGPKTLESLAALLQEAKTVIWNGPLGVFEHPPYDVGSCQTAKLIAHLTQKKQLFSLAGGGETVAVLTQSSCHQDFSYVSTAGGAFLEFMEGKTLPGLKALDEANTPTGAVL